jgi:hypothetical protein
MRHIKLFEAFNHINEQDADGGLMKDFLKQGFKNCRGITLAIKDIEDPIEGISDKERKKIERQITKDDKKEWNAFVKDNGLDSKKIDFDYYLSIKDYADRLRGFNISGNYTYLFEDDGKTFTKDMTQKIVNDIQKIFKDKSFWFFYLRNIFGNKTPSKIDIYKYLDSQGGKQKLDELVKSDFDSKTTKEKFVQTVEEFENRLKDKFPFQIPEGKTPFYFSWRDGNKDKMRYFNTYEEWKLSLAIVKQEANISPTTDENEFTSYASARFAGKPNKGKATPLLFK